jgi:hypothetical protein
MVAAGTDGDPQGRFARSYPRGPPPVRRNGDGGQHDIVEGAADLYGVATKTLNQTVARNIARFPSDSSFQLTPDEAASLRSWNESTMGSSRQCSTPSAS